MTRPKTGTPKKLFERRNLPFIKFVSRSLAQHAYIKAARPCLMIKKFWLTAYTVPEMGCPMVSNLADSILEKFRAPIGCKLLVFTQNGYKKCVW